MRPRGKHGGDSGLSAARLRQGRRPEVTGVVKGGGDRRHQLPPAATEEEIAKSKKWIKEARQSLDKNENRGRWKRKS
jgi:hypothetical protein